MSRTELNLLSYRGSFLAIGIYYTCRTVIEHNIIKCVLNWLVGCFGFNGPLRQYFSLYRAVPQREGERGEKE